MATHQKLNGFEWMDLMDKLYESGNLDKLQNIRKEVSMDEYFMMVFDDRVWILDEKIRQLSKK